MTAQPGTANLSAEARRLRHAVAAAPDAVLAKVVAVFDSLPDRREADALLDAARPRLRRLRPPRPIAFTRLLFLPLDGAILEPRAWRRQEGTLPRTALVPLAGAIRAAIGPAAAEIEAATAGRSFADHAALDAAGRRLWRLAAEAGPGPAPPPGWQEAGLSAADYRQAAALATGVWRCAGPLWAALAVARFGPPEDLTKPALMAALTEGPAVLAAALSTLMLKAAKPGGVAAIAVDLPGAPAAIAERVLDDWLAECRPEIPLADPAGAAGMAEAFREALDDLADSRLAQRAERRQRIAAIRREAAEACRTAHAEAAEGVLAALASGDADDAAIGALEATARQVRRLEQAARGLGAASAFDAATHRMAERIATLRGKPGIGTADLVRIAEILVGPEAAMRMLEAG